MRLQFDAQFSEALNIINSSIRAGNSVIQGIEQCGQKIDGVLGDEFRQISQRLEIGEDAESVFWPRGDACRLANTTFHHYRTAEHERRGQVKEVMSRLGTLISNAGCWRRKIRHDVGSPHVN
ncbi:hypothetical protein DMB90_08685 [Raoultella planticola]|uniref:Uncharacterized protein n=1 Tax=Raoultella planticola TaxID=575 RepID=A0A5P6AAD3_RAOPL|nr:hypothetical protein DMB90_08685 [Raoultella planticola]